MSSFLPVSNSIVLMPVSFSAKSCLTFSIHGFCCLDSVSHPPHDNLMPPDVVHSYYTRAKRSSHVNVLFLILSTSVSLCPSAFWIASYHRHQRQATSDT